MSLETEMRNSSRGRPSPLSGLSKLKGRVIRPDDDTYDDARQIFYGGFEDRRPAAIVCAADASDVARVVTLARETGVQLAIRSGGHSVAGHGTSEGGIVLDLSDMRGLAIDTRRRTAWAQAGLTAGEYTEWVGAHGLATGFGDTGSVGIGGITLGGGIGFLVRKHGMTIDNLIAADVVTADGELKRVDEELHPDLFWAIRGGGGNFGVATRFKFRLNEVRTIVGGYLVLPAAPSIISSFALESEAAPEGLSSIFAVMPAPPMPLIPEEWHGRPVVIATMVYAGDVEAGERALAPFRALAKPIVDTTGPMRYPELFPAEEVGYHPTAIGRTMFVETVDRGMAETIVDRVENSDASMRVAQLRVLGGAMSRVSVEATAYAHRNSKILVNVASFYDSEEEKPVREAWVAEFASEISQDDTGAYVGFLAEEGDERVRAAYPGATWDRLRTVKRKYDPDNLFRVNQNIQPADG